MEIIEFLRQFGEYGLLGLLFIICVISIYKLLSKLADRYQAQIENAKVFAKITEENTQSNIKLAITMENRNIATEKLAIAVEKQTGMLEEMQARQHSYAPVVEDLKRYIEERRKRDHEKNNHYMALIAELTARQSKKEG